MPSLEPGTTKTRLVNDLLVNGETIEEVYCAKAHRQLWLVCIRYETGTEVIARCTMPYQAAAIAHAVAGSVDADLILGDDLTTALAEDG